LLLEKVLRIGYYPLKLRMIVAGMIQLRPRDRFTSEEVSSLLREYKEKIRNFQTFHLRKTAFELNFREKLAPIEGILSRLKQEMNADLFSNCPSSFAAQNKSREDFTSLKYTASNRKDGSEVHGNFEQSINFSITHLGKTNRHADMESLMLSKSENKSLPQEKGSGRDPSLSHTDSAEIIKATEISLHSRKGSEQEELNPFREFEKESSRKSLEGREYVIQSNDSFRKTQHYSAIPKCTRRDPLPDKDCEEREQIEEEEQPEEQQEEQQEEQSVTVTAQEMKASANLEKIESEKRIKLESNKENEQEISRISQKHKEQSEGDLSHSSSVVEYVSELYEAERHAETPSEHPPA
jgi:hypothetical protein